ncbi:MAG: hypothetical protein Q8L86_18315 [Vicinamibacterales bacterium]|nr:hypothetical protein [Vicinamibacterales bacterium]
MRGRLAASTLALVVVLLAPSPVHTQAPALAGDLMLLSVIDFKPDQFTEFGELQAQTMAAQQKGGQAWRETWNVATFGHPYRVYVLRPLTGFAELDGQSFTVKGAGAEQARMINEKARGMITGQQIFALRTRPDLGYGSRPSTPSVSVMTTIGVAPGRNAEFEAVVRDMVIPAYKKAGETSLAIAQVGLGGDSNQYVVFTHYSNFAALANGHPILRALGPDGYAAYRQRIAGIVTLESHTVVRYNPALSFR